MQAGLGSEFPSFVKLLAQSHVSSCFWIGLPTPFCKVHLPNEDAILILEDENGECTELEYVAEKTGLNAGWRKFAVGQKLLEGDVLLFHLVEPLKFKVYVVRQNELTDEDGAVSQLNMDENRKQIQAANERGTIKPLTIRKRKHPSEPTIIQKKNKKMLVSRSVWDLGQLTEQSGNDSEEVGSEILEGSKLSKTSVPFKYVNSFEDFHIVVNDVCIDSELTEDIRLKYYDLCCKKKAFLHGKFFPGLYPKLIAGIIGETVNIADAIKGCKHTTSWDEFAVWDKSLKSFELLGMEVGFVRDRLHKLRGLAFESQGASDFKNYLGAIPKRIHAEDEIRIAEAKLVELKAASEKNEADFIILRSKAEKHVSDFQEEVDAPW
ncbi:B3 domain-containing protein Os01g0234100-like [Apium graveolens]|uniref:B3 domain-containing protein Os01g0234100-like n=1 Tax=Apium graveolens TaxID=4045 RepID=UPI003D78ED67